MSKIKNELLDYMERHNLSDVQDLDGVTFDEIIKENRKCNG